jgi:hypothetical protein
MFCLSSLFFPMNFDNLECMASYVECMRAYLRIVSRGGLGDSIIEPVDTTCTDLFTPVKVQVAGSNDLFILSTFNLLTQ